jgi:hypothetical protein
MSSARGIAAFASAGVSSWVATAAIGIAAPQSVVWQSQGQNVHDFLGTSLDVTGDFDGDGKPDVLAGAPNDEFSTIPGHVQVIGSLSGAVLFDLVGKSIGDRFGAAVASAGDVDGDGIDDWIVGAPGDATAAAGAGAARVYSGATKARLFEWFGGAAGDEFGSAVAGAVDLDGDGVGDVVVTADRARTVTAFSAKTGAQLWQMGGGAQSGRFGQSLAVMDDLDGDGVRDVLVGAPRDTTLGTNEGAAYAFSGKAGTLLLTLTASNSQLDFGSQVAGAKDVDGDGTPDLLVSNPRWGSNPAKDDGKGSAWIFSGKTGAQLLQAQGSSVDQGFGSSLLAWSDADKDGAPDFIVGDRPTGAVRIVSSATGKTLLSLDSDHGNAPLAPIADLDGDGIADFVTANPRSFGPYFLGAGAGVIATFRGNNADTLALTYGASYLERRGAAVAVLGDIDGDGWDDVLVASTGPSDYTNRSSSLRILSGRDGSELRRQFGDYGNTMNGNFLVTVPDFNGDGIAEYAVYERNGLAADVFSGSDGSWIYTLYPSVHYPGLDPPALAAGTSPNGQTVVAAADTETPHIDIWDMATGAQIGAIYGPGITGFGMALAFLGDVDGDSIGDWAVGNPHDGNAESGAAYFYSGNNKGILYYLLGQTQGDHFASSLSAIGDLDGDGVRDVLIGAPAAGSNYGGTVTVVSAKTGATITTLTGSVFKGEFGRSIGTLGDVNHDGVEDFAVAANEPNGSTTTGRVYVYSGRTFGLLAKFESPDGITSFGPALCSNSSGVPTDVDHDGVPDLVVGTPDADGPLHAGGTATLIRLDDLLLQATPTHVAPGQTETLDTRGGPASNLAAAFAVAFDGAPLSILVALGSLDAFGAWSLSATVPPGFSGHTATFRSYAIGFTGKAVDSSDVVVTFD